MQNTIDLTHGVLQNMDRDFTHVNILHPVVMSEIYGGTMDEIYGGKWKPAPFGMAYNGDEVKWHIRAFGRAGYMVREMILFIIDQSSFSSANF